MLKCGTQVGTIQQPSKNQKPWSTRLKKTTQYVPNPQKVIRFGSLFCLFWFYRLCAFRSCHGRFSYKSTYGRVIVFVIRISAPSELVQILPCLKQDGYTKLSSVYAAQFSGYTMLEYQIFQRILDFRFCQITCSPETTPETSLKI